MSGFCIEGFAPKVPDVEKRIRADRIVDTGLTLEEKRVFCAMEKFRVYSELSFQCSRHFTALRLLPSPASSRSSRHRLRNGRHHPHHRRHHHFLQVFRLSRDQAAGQLLVKQTFGVGLTSLLTTKHLEGFPSTCWHIDPRPETARQHSACRVSISRNRGLSKQSLNACT